MRILRDLASPCSKHIIIILASPSMKAVQAQDLVKNWQTSLHHQRLFLRLMIFEGFFAKLGSKITH